MVQQLQACQDFAVAYSIYGHNHKEGLFKHCQATAADVAKEMKEEKGDEDTTANGVKSMEISKFEENYTDAAEDIKQETINAAEKKLFSMDVQKGQ
eukprot:383548-Ditylum_brightwellii.AAC.1